MNLDGFAIQRLDRDGARRLELSGELDMATAPDVKKELGDFIDGQRVVVDTTRLDFVDSHGLIPLVEGRDRLGPRFELIPGQATEWLLDLTGLREFFGLGNP